MAFFSRRIILLAIGLAIGLLGPAGPANARADKLDRALRAIVARKSDAAWRGRKQHVILQLADTVARRPLSLAWHRDDSTRLARVRGKVRQFLGGEPGQFPLIRSLGAELTPEAIETLAADPDVARVSADLPMRPTLDVTAPSLSTPVLWQTGLDGRGVTVAVIDSGIYPHPDLMDATGRTSRILAFQDFVAHRTRPYDDFGHGTHVAGIIAGNGRNSSGPGSTRAFIGIAPGANLVGLKVLDRNGEGTVSRVIEAISWCIANRDRYGIRVINLSMGHPVYESYRTDPLCQACERAWEAGIVVVCSAGNLGENGYSSITCPGNDPWVITVGAVKTFATPDRRGHQVTNFSSRGPTAIDHVLKPDVVAPGNRIVSLEAPNSTLLRDYAANRVSVSPHGRAARPGTGYFELSGTSMAAPAVAGTAALMIQRDPWITPTVVKGRLMQTAEKLATADIYSRGAGYLRADRAVASLDVPFTSVSPAMRKGPFAVLLEAPLYGDGAAWSEVALWGDEALWGENVIWTESALWGEHVIWTESALTGEHVIWTESALASENVIWAENAFAAANTLWSEPLPRMIEGEN